MKLYLLLVVYFLCFCTSQRVEAQSTNSQRQVSETQITTPSITTKSYPLGDVRNCPTTSPMDSTQPLYQMDVLPGIGFDNLRNVDMGQVLNYNYSQCKISSDGKYLLPDGIYLIPIKESNIETFAEFFDHWDKHTSLTSFSINSHGSGSYMFAKISGKFSAGYMSTKTHMYQDKSKTTRVQLRHKLYAVKVQPDSTLHPTFKHRIFDIAAYLQRNNTEHAHYLAEVLIREYGTHYLTSMEAGAVLVQTDFVSSDYVDNSSTHTKSVTASASVSFYNKISVGFGFGVQKNSTNDEKFMNSRTFSKVNAIGGPPFRPNFTVEEWEAGIPDGLVAIDRAGDPLHFLVNPSTVPELPEMTIISVSNIIYEAANRYFQVNTHPGCTNPKSKNFDFHANVDDGYCVDQTSHDNFTFGGVFQRCTDDSSNDPVLCERLNQENPLSHGTSCPDSVNYIAVKLFSGVVKGSSCHKVLKLFKKCHEVQASYESYWCATKSNANVGDNSGYLFGGFYTTISPNPLTNTMGCPHAFFTLNIGSSMKVCVSTDYQSAYSLSVPFAGFDSCQSGNPLALNPMNDDPGTWPRDCPQGYTRYFGGVENGCDINLCIKNQAFTTNDNSLLPPRLPPFHTKPTYQLNDSHSLSFIGSDGKIWVKNVEGKWVNNGQPSCFYGSHEIDGACVSEEFDQQDGNTNTGSGSVSRAAAISIPTVLIGLVVVCLTIGIIVFISYRSRKRRNGYCNIENSDGHDNNSNN